MAAVGIVAEYNPFHKGHALHLRRSAELAGDGAVLVCVMSGDFVQRGEAAVFSKYDRAEAACRCGADLVIELPLPWSLSSAEGFARGAVSLLGALRCTHISFGSEAGAAEPLDRLADLLLQPAFAERLRSLIEANPDLSFAAARQRAASFFLPELAGFLSEPNNILGIEYLKAIRSLRLPMIPITVKRLGSRHDGEGGELPSGAELRKKLLLGESVEGDVPREAYEVYSRSDCRTAGFPDRRLLEIALMARLRALKEEDLARLPDGADGLSRRLFRAAAEGQSLDEIMTAVKTKRYALSRIRRMLCCAALGIDASLSDGTPPYARVLAAGPKGRRYLREIGEDAACPIIVKPAAIRGLDERAVRVFDAGARAHDLYALGFPDPEARRGGADWRTGPFIL